MCLFTTCTIPYWQKAWIMFHTQPWLDSKQSDTLNINICPSTAAHYKTFSITCNLVQMYGSQCSWSKHEVEWVLFCVEIVYSQQVKSTGHQVSVRSWHHFLCRSGTTETKLPRGLSVCLSVYQTNRKNDQNMSSTQLQTGTVKTTQI